MPKTLLIVNPQSAGGETGHLFTSMKGTIERAIGGYEVAMTERPGHAIDLAREGALAGHPLVIAVGGDGTLHEVVNGLMQAKTSGYGAKGGETELGLIGQGTGGDFRKSLGLEHRLDRYLDAIRSGHRTTIDVGRFSGGGKTRHYFVNILSAGMGGLVDRYVAESSRVFGGGATYFGASLKALLNAKLGHLRCAVTLDGTTAEHKIRSFMIAICNGRYFGGGMMIAPMAEIDDGAFEIVALGATSKLAFGLYSRDIYAGKHIDKPGTVHLRGQKIVLDIANHDARSSYLLDVDGEPMGELPVTIEVVPKALTLRA